MAHGGAIITASAGDGAVVDGEDNGVTQGERYDGGAGLHARALFGEEEFTAGEVRTGGIEQDGDLEREDVFAVEVLVEAVEITGAVTEEEGCGARLTGGVAAGGEFGMGWRVADGVVQPFVPVVGEGGEGWVKGGAQPFDQWRRG